MLVPIGDGHEGNPEFTVPIINGLIGSFSLAPGGDVKTTLLDHSWKRTPEGFETTGTLLLNGGRLKQTLRMTSIGRQTVVYDDRVVALSNVTVRSELGLPVGIENDEISGGTRVLLFQNGKRIIDCKKPRQTVALSGSWVDVDGRLGMVTLAGQGIRYAQASGYSPGISVCADVLYGSCLDQPRKFQAAEEVARRVAVFVVEAGARETSAVAQSCRIEKERGGKVLHFNPPEGKGTVVPLL
jgi:hypothetical protein